MNAVGRLISRGVYTVSGPFHPFGGCVDIIVVEQQDGTFKSSPWYVRFGKFQGVLKTREKVVKICVNGSDADFHMFLDHKGEAHFLREIDDDVVEEVDSLLPISDDDDAVEAPARSQSCRFDSGDDKALARTNSRRARIFGLVFGRRSVRESDGVGRAESLERAELAANLLEVKWSTNLDTNTAAMKDNSLRLYDSDSKIDGELDKVAKADESVAASECGTVANVNECGGEQRFGETEVSECGVSDENGTESFIYCESSESSIVRMDNSSEQTHETVYIATGESGELRVRSEMLCARTKPTLEDTVVEHYLEDYELEALPALASAGEAISRDIPAISGFENLFQCSKDEEKVKVDGEEEQLLFGDIDDHKIGEAPRIETSFPEEEDKDIYLEGVEELHGLIDKSDRSHSPPEKSADFERLTGNLTVSSDPIAITGARKVIDEEVGRLTESLPNLWLPTESFGADGVNCLSHSLDSTIKPLIWSIQSKDNSSITKIDGDLEFQSDSELPAMNSALESGDSKDISSNPAVEMSLCKHLFFQGMGSDAASQAFDAEKLDLEKFNHLGPEVVKDSRLVVRINGHYYPWDVAAPIVLGMASFGNSHEFEPKGMISVDQVEKTVTGNWRMWPFSSFKRSRSQKIVSPSLSDLRNSESENASAVNISAPEDASKTEPKAAKKLLKVLRPTSEQLASLGLKEGVNTVTFTFLTPMLGKQQVDCRIYLWKWNTRIVISDVDGTITRSDVLGQFMPLVGVDWSHLGVAHLFSAIKENGYQLLFLSARAISQAYITRQFLFNLKQDGKALPDGPVVISPDGLFPSLYREVIRRAPHEFKISCLEEIRSLFPPDCNPFYAGFGNRDTDEISYLKVGIPKGKIFIINPKGEVAVNRRVDTKSYKSIHALVNGMFPSTASSEQEDYNSWNFWKLPPPLMDG